MQPASQLSLHQGSRIRHRYIPYQNQHTYKYMQSRHSLMLSSYPSHICSVRRCRYSRRQSTQTYIVRRKSETIFSSVFIIIVMREREGTHNRVCLGIGGSVPLSQQSPTAPESNLRWVYEWRSSISIYDDYKTVPIAVFLSSHYVLKYSRYIVLAQ